MSKRRRLQEEMSLVEGFQDMDSSIIEDLYDILYKLGNSAHFHKAQDIFNKPFNLNDLIIGFDSRLSELMQTYNDGTLSGFIDDYVRLDDIVLISHALKSSALKRFNTLPDGVRKIVRNCQYHAGYDCRLIDQKLGFILYLSWLELAPSKEDDKEEPLPEEISLVSLPEPEDLEIELQEIEESALVEDFDTASFKADALSKVEDYSQALKEEEEEGSTLQCLPVFPTYCFNNKEYLLLANIQYLFDMREDFALALMARWGQADKGFVDSNQPCPFSILDTKGDDFLDKNQAVSFCVDMIEQYEKHGIPTEEQFKEIQERMGIANWGLDSTASTSKDEALTERKTSINLYTDSILDIDETPQTEIEDIDNFLGRAKGSRSFSIGKSQSLFHYIGHLKEETTAVFHTKFSDDSVIPLMAFKAFSRFVGSRPINKGVEKIILIEKQEAIRIFGYMPGVAASRASYFAAHAGYMLSHVGSAKEMLKLKDYRKQEYLKYRGKVDK